MRIEHYRRIERYISFTGAMALGYMIASESHDIRDLTYVMCGFVVLTMALVKIFIAANTAQRQGAAAPHRRGEAGTENH